MTIQSLIVTIGSGGLVGFALGLLGGGGSILATPLLLYVVGVTNPHIAIGTSAVAVSANAYTNLIAHAWKGHVWWRSAVIFALVGTLGAFLGSSIGMLIGWTAFTIAVRFTDGHGGSADAAWACNCSSCRAPPNCTSDVYENQLRRNTHGCSIGLLRDWWRFSDRTRPHFCD